MGVDSELWWSVWWPWVVVLVVGVAALIAGGWTFMVARRARHRFAPVRTVRGSPFYLDQPEVEGICRANTLVGLVAKEVTRTVGVTKDGKLALPGASLDVGKATSSQIVETYIEKKEAIDVVGVLLNALDDGAELLHANLGNRTMERGAALERAMAKTGEASGRLHKLKSYVLVEGEFQYAEDGDGSVIFKAPIGNPADPGDKSRMRVECEEAWLVKKDRATSKVPFDAVCFGRMLPFWEEPELTIRPIVIFH
ncbi:hypothetical protein JOF56_001336 [Kibdelosporangium banguiense]|uniref:Uncharacterized protein n=1 Tax=Kibdelosporangium banguiense TaxID=1365924 RepID=A0ABS4TAT2_9PSEU|nr:hypothetical protein [Kibdelosporangium banguiense]MBP2320951.1 hypothetical protein [Kibdelosporangium banguiense]